LTTSAQAAKAEVVLIDCLTLLVSNVLLSGGPDAPEPDVEVAWRRVQAEIEGLLAAQRQLQCPFVVVSNEVGLGIVPAYALGRTYRDCLGWANQALACAAGQVIWLVAGLPVDLKALPLAWLD
jgi:adenosylcobinamide kinase/adenosylcobinamide-phosphate guanylyltransferase